MTEKPQQQTIKIPVLKTLELPGRRWAYANRSGRDLELVTDKGERVKFFDYFNQGTKKP